MRVIGVTGGIGCGKTEFCRILASFEAVVFNSDDEARRLQDGGDQAITEQIINAFGKDVYDKQGNLLRSELGKIVFADNAKLATLNAIIHPAVIALFKKRKQECLMNGVTILVKEAAILFEANIADGLDAVIIVTASLGVRLKRLEARGLNRQDAMARINSQLPSEAKNSRADYIVQNNGSLEELKKQAKEVWKQINTDL